MRAWTAIESHLASRDVARIIYGAIVGLSLVVVLQDHPPPAGEVVAALAATAISVGLAELYSEAVAAEARALRRATFGVTREIRSPSCSGPCSRASSSSSPPLGR